MSTYNNNRFTPGNKAGLRQILNKAYIKQYYHAFTISQKNTELCECVQPKFNKAMQGWNNPLQTQNTRISHALTGTLGGKITFGNNNKPVTINYLGGWEGQPGGQFRPLRNKF